jgi:hypothetical protein
VIRTRANVLTMAAFLRDRGFLLARGHLNQAMSRHDAAMYADLEAYSAQSRGLVPTHGS